MCWLISSSSYCSSRLSTNSRTLPAWPKPPDPTRRLASAATTRCLATPSHHSAAHNRSPATIQDCTPPTSPRTAQKKTSISNDDPTILTPMRKSGAREQNDLHRCGRHAAVDDDGLAGHEARGIGAEIGDRASDLVGFADPA